MVKIANMKLLTYNHPAFSQKYGTSKTYTLDELRQDGLSDDQIRILFKPVNFTWDEIETKVEPKPKSEPEELWDEIETKVEPKPKSEPEELMTKAEPTDEAMLFNKSKR